MTAALPSNETERLAALQGYHILDTAPEQAFDDITRLAAMICETPVAFMSLVDKDRQWMKSKVGSEAIQTPREQAFCAHTILNGHVMVVEDATKDLRFSDNPLVTSAPNIRFYAGAPLVTPSGQALGSMCVIDNKPRKLSRNQEEALERLSRITMNTLEWRRISGQLSTALEKITTLSSLLPICSYCHEVRNDEGYWEQVESFVQTHMHTQFSHGICPKCAEKHFKDF